MRRNLWTTSLLALATVVAVSACAAQEPANPTPTPTTGDVPSVTPSGSPKVTPTPTSTTPTPTAVTTATPTPTPTLSATPAGPLMLTGTGLSTVKFGATEKIAEAALIAELGNPDTTFEDVACQLDPKSPWQRTLSYDGLSVVFTADSKSPKAPRKLSAWYLALEDLRLPVVLPDGVPVQSTFKQLQTKYPKAVLADTGLGDGTRTLTLPNGIRFLGAELPDTVSAGEMQACE